MTKDFLLGFLAGILFILVLFMMSPPSPSTKRRKQQPVARRGNVIDIYEAVNQ